MIAELLGPRGFGLVREDHLHLMEQALARRRVSGDENVSDFFAASCAELAIWMQTAFRQLTVPLDINPELITLVEYKCNTFSSSLCEPHISPDDNRAGYAFLFVSDYWKMRRLLGDTDVLRALVSNPAILAEAIGNTEWDFAPQDDERKAKDLTVMLWSAKAHILTGASRSQARASLIEYAANTRLSARIPGIKPARQEYASSA